MKIILWVIIFSSTFSISFYYGRDISQFITSTIQKKESFKEAGKEINQKSNKNLENQSKEITLNNKAENDSKITLANKEEKLIDQMRSSPQYKEVQKKMSKSEASGFIYDFMTKINLEDGPFMNALNDEIEESFYKEAEKNPEKLFKSIEENIDNFMGSPIQQAELMDYLTKINGMEEKAKEVILNNLNKRIPEQEMKLTDIKTLEDENKFFSADPKEIAYKMKFASLISVAENQEEEKKLTMDVFNRQKNKNIQRDIASVYLKKNPTKANNFVDDIGLKKANNLVPSNIEIEDNGNGEYTFIKLIEPKKKEDPEDPENPENPSEIEVPGNNENPQDLKD